MILQLTVHNLELGEAYREDLKARAEELSNYYGNISRCRVVVEVPHRHRRDGAMYNVEIELRVPGSELIVKRQQDKDLDIAIRDAFDSARRKLEDYARKQRGDVKLHEEAPRAEISALLPDKDCGFLKTPDGREIYFHSHSVINRDFKRLKVGEKVRFAEEAGEKGPQASTVTVED